MFWKSYRLWVIIFSAGLAWSFCSDRIISALARDILPGLVEFLRGINNAVLFSVTGILSYRLIRKQQRQLKTSEKQYRDLFDSNPNPMWVYDRETLAFVAVNDAAIQKYGYSHDEFLNRTIKDIRPADDRSLLEKPLKSDHSGIRKSGIWQHIKKSGELFPVSIVSHELTFNQRPCKMVMATDMGPILQNEQIIEEAYQKEKQLHEQLAVNFETARKAQEETQLMAQVINKISNLVLIISQDNIILWVNQAFADFTGYPLEYATGKRPAEILFGPETDQRAIERLSASLKEKIFFNEEIIKYKKNAESYWTELSVSPIYDEGGDFKFFVSIENVITERKEKEQKILAQHAMLQDVAWTNSHQLRRPVCSVIGLIGVLKNAPTEIDRNECMYLLEKSAGELDLLLKTINEKIEQSDLAENPTLSPVSLSE
jgi:PAS domain S-box-containing protein